MMNGMGCGYGLHKTKQTFYKEYSIPEIEHFCMKEFNEM